jgi:hypothetical protein
LRGSRPSLGAVPIPKDEYFGVSPGRLRCQAPFIIVRDDVGKGPCRPLLLLWVETGYIIYGGGSGMGVKLGRLAMRDETRRSSSVSPCSCHCNSSRTGSLVSGEHRPRGNRHGVPGPNAGARCSEARGISTADEPPKAVDDRLRGLMSDSLKLLPPCRGEQSGRENQSLMVGPTDQSGA